VPRLVHAASIFLLLSVNDGIVKSVAAAVFNIRVGVEHLPLMYSWIAVLFALGMAVLSWLTAKVARQRLLFGLLGFVTVLLLINSFFLHLQSRGGWELHGSGFYPFLFVSSELARSMVGFHIWIVAGGICYTSRAKALFPLLAASAILGDITGGFAVRLLGPRLEAFALYGIAVANMLLIILLLRPLVRRYFVTQLDDQGEGAASIGENLRYLGQSAYLKLLFVLSIATFAIYTTIHYGFNVVARQHYASEAEITSFFGLFYGTTGVATLIFSTFLLRHVLRWLGAGNVYMWVCAVYAVVSIALYSGFSGILPLSAVAAIFAFNLVNYLLLDSVIAPSYQVLIKLVPARNSDGTRMIMEGGFMLLGGLVGAGVTLLHARALLTLDQLFLVLTLIGVVMLVAGWRLKRSYTDVLVRAVREQDIDMDDEHAMQALGEVLSSAPEVSRDLLVHTDDGVRQMGIEILRKNPGAAADTVCLPLVEHANPRIRAAALEAINPHGGSTGMIDAVIPLIDDEDPEVRLSSARALSRLLGSGNGIGSPIENTMQERITDSVLPRIEADDDAATVQAEFLTILDRLHHEPSASQRDRKLRELLGNEATEAIIAGIETAGAMGDSAHYERMLELADHPHPAVREAVAANFSDYSHEGVFDVVLGLLADPDPDVVSKAVEGLKNFAEPAQRSTMVSLLEKRPLNEWVGLMAALSEIEERSTMSEVLDASKNRLTQASRYLIAIEIMEDLDASGELELLVDQLKAQNRIVQNGVIRLLGHMSDVGVVNALIERLSEDDAEARENSIELLENIADRELMEYLLPLLDDENPERRAIAGELSGWQNVDADDVLRYLLTVPDPWTQLAAVWSIFVLDKQSLIPGEGAGLDPLVREALSELQKQGVSVAAEEHLPLTTMDKITFLKQSQFFAALPLEELYHIASSMQEETVRANTTVIEEGTLGDKMYIVVRGKLEVFKAAADEGEETQRIALLTERQVFGDMALLDDEPRSASVVTLEDVHLLSLERSSLERILRRYSSIAFNMMRILSQRLRDSMAA
jgi:HEAT repeat protein